MNRLSTLSAPLCRTTEVTSSSSTWMQENKIVKVRLTGACGSCPMSQMTLRMGVERVLKEEIPEITEVVAV